MTDDSSSPTQELPKPFHPKRDFRGFWCSLTLILAMTAVPLLVPAPALSQDFTDKVIYSFRGGADGNEPLFSGVVPDKAGNLYGTTYSGGTYHYGTVFKLDPAGKETILYSFGNGSDGKYLSAGVVLDPAGNIFGTTTEGGIRAIFCDKGCGTVFEIEPNGHERVLHAFTGGADGGLPTGRLVRDSEGNLYGTTELGGTSSNGTIYKIDASGTLTVLHSFTGQPDGQNPQGGVIRDSEGNLYGTTASGGTDNFGAVFKLDSTGQETVLYSFLGSSKSDGEDPVAPLFRTANGDLYGTTFLGGVEGLGTAYKVDADGNETNLHTFGNAQNDGTYPESPLISDSRGNLYGTTIQGGTYGLPGGVMYRITPQGDYSIVYNFGGKSNGSAPAGPLLASPNGSFFGTTTSGGAAGPGTVYQIMP